MSTKFNRNDPQVLNDKFYPEDYKTDLNGVEQDHQESIQDFEVLPCIVSGGDVTEPAWPSLTALVSACRARDKDGKPVAVPEEQEVTLLNTAGGNNYIILKHKYSTDASRFAYFNPGTEFDTRKYDDFEIEVAETYAEGDIILANIKKVGDVWLKYLAERTRTVYKPTVSDITPPSDPTNLVLTSGIMGDSTLPLYADTVYITRKDNLAWIKAVWTASVDPESGIRGYEVFLIPLDLTLAEQLALRQEQGARYSASAPRTDVTFQNLTPGVKYRIKVRAIDNAGNLSALVQADIIAGGAKIIPDTCEDGVQSIVSSAEDTGIQITIDVKPEHANKVHGFEIVWTDDDTAPDFLNKNHKKIFTDRHSITLPAPFSTAQNPKYVKAKIRLVDKIGFHCTTPFSLGPIKTKEYPADLKTKLNEFAEAKALINAFARGQISWENVRVVAKSGGQYSTWQSAVNSVNTTEFTLIMGMPGLYEEEVKIDYNKNIGFLGIGDVWVSGRIYSDPDHPGYVHYADNIGIINTLEGVIPFDIIIQSYASAAYLNRLRIKQTNATSGDAVKITNATPVDVVKLIIDDCTFKSVKGKGLILATDELYAEIRNNTFIDAYKNLHIQCGASPSVIKLRISESKFNIGAGASFCITTEAADPKPIIYMANCKYNKAPDTDNLTCDFGAVDNVTNVLFNDNDLQSII